MKDIGCFYKNLIKDIWNTYNNLIESIELRGSSMLPWFKEYRDIDVIIICKDEDAVKKLRKLKHTPGNVISDARGYSLDITFDTRENQISKLRELCVLYQTNFTETLYGNKYKYKQQNQSIEDLRKKALKIIDESKINPYVGKEWYHIFLNICFIKNNAYELTEEQINKLKIVKAYNTLKQEERNKIIEEDIKTYLDL